MSDHLTPIQVEGHGRGLLPAAELLAVSDHLAGCEKCRRQLEWALNGDVEYLALKAELFGETGGDSSPMEPAHLEFEAMAALVDGTLAGEELQIARDHLVCCEQCELAVRDLRAFKEQVAPGLDREYLPSAPRDSAADRWERLSIFWRRTPALAFGSALAALLLAAGGWLAWREWRGPQARPALTEVQPSPAPATPAPATPAPATESPLLVMLNDGEGRVTLDREHRLSGADRLSPAEQQLIERTLTARKIERSPLLAELSRPEDRPRGSGRDGNQKFGVTEPVGEVIISDRPTFRWTTLDGATSYRVEVYYENLDLALESPPVTEQSWTAPEPLKRGRVYLWQVKAAVGDRTVVTPLPPAPEVKFRILDQARAEELSRARRAYASSHLALGLLYAQAGVLSEAERELHALQRANPDAELARQLLKQVRALRGL
ncbi:MAG TPA: hypothetical protein VJ302_36740 [Blastocatellia bacterium]|nr:hypothetical protein [Blastocatellia bacterium]